MALKKIEFIAPRHINPKKLGENCPQCKEAPTIWKQMPCPEGLPGCCTIHYGYQCSKCGDWFKKAK